MKYILLFTLGILTGLSFSRIPHYVNQYADHSLPKPDWEAPKLRGAWTADDIAVMNRYFNGGKELT